MTQPMNRSCEIQPKGEIDEKSGEFWVNNPFEMLSGKHNFSAYESNKLLLNRENGSFVDLSYESGTNIDSDSRSVIVGDFDRDGDSDLLVASVGGGAMRLFLNQIPRDGHRVRIDLRGTTSNRQGIGSRIVAQVGERTITRDLFPTNGFMGQSPTEMILGVGDAEKIDRLTVRWPTGETQQFDNVPVDVVLGITEGESTYQSQRETWMPAFSP